MFHECKTVEEKKKLYRRLSKHLHPDCGGEADLMALLTRAFEMAVSFAGFSPDDEEEEQEEKWDGVIKHENKSVSINSDKIAILAIILEYAKCHPNFKTDFVLSIKVWLQTKGFMTAKQYNCLVDLFYSRKIDEWAKKRKMESR